MKKKEFYVKISLSQRKFFDRVYILRQILRINRWGRQLFLQVLVIYKFALFTILPYVSI